MFRWEILVIARKAKRVVIYIESFKIEEKEEETLKPNVQYPELTKLIKEKAKNFFDIFITAIVKTMLPI